MTLCFANILTVPTRPNLAVWTYKHLTTARRILPRITPARMCNPTSTAPTARPHADNHVQNGLTQPSPTPARAVSLPASEPPLYSIAPMMDVTDRHFRALARLISRHATLYTEMVVDRSLIHNPTLRHFELRLPDKPSQHPVVLQLGGSDADLMAQAAAFTTNHAYSEININCGCPSPKVADNGCFGAALMKSPHLVASIARSMSSGLQVPVTVKCRLGLDDDTSYDSLRQFVKIVHDLGGVDHFIIHARNAILGGLSPAQNRKIPPLRYDVVYQLIGDFPHLRFSINGGIRTIDDVLMHLSRGVYGVMVGRAVMDAPWRALRDVDTRVYGIPNTQPDGQATTRRHVLNAYKEYAVREVRDTGCSVRSVMKPLLNLFHGERHGKLWRRAIDSGLKTGHSADVLIDEALLVLSDDVVDEPCGWQPPDVPRVPKDASADGRDIDVRDGGDRSGDSSGGGAPRLPTPIEGDLRQVTPVAE